jgi:hypothetical protein
VPAGSINSKDWPKLAMPASMPSANGAVGAPWSSVPLWRGLDSAFLCEPAIPKAPPTPRFHVDEVIAVPALPDNPFMPSAKKAGAQVVTPATTKRRATPARMLIVSAALGFVGGMLVAWCSGLFG